MNFLVTNDDGIDAPGLAALTRLAEAFGAPVIVAPALAQSGISHRVTDNKTPIRFEQQTARRFCIHGTPADCVRIGLTQLAPDTDWVLAGINYGGNLGADIYLSGTVAAAREAALLGRRAIAVSHYVARDHSVDWDTAESRVAPVLRMLLSRELPPRHFWNVNLPHPSHNDINLDTVFCAVDTGSLSIRYRRDGDHFIYTGIYHERSRQPGRDVDVCLNGAIAVTCIPLDITSASLERRYRS